MTAVLETGAKSLTGSNASERYRLGLSAMDEVLYSTV